jgi:hypothetical protein
MAKVVMFEAAVKRAVKFGKRLGASDGERPLLQTPPLRQELADMTGDLIVWLTALKARLEKLPAPPSATVQAAQRLGLEEQPIHRTVRGDMVRSKSAVAIANILYGIEREGRLTYRIAPDLPFANRSAPQADFKIEANGTTWFWEHCAMRSDEKYRRRWEQKKELYAKNGYSAYSPDNPEGRLIVTEDSPETGLDTQAIDRLTQKLFGKSSRRKQTRRRRVAYSPSTVELRPALAGRENCS